MTQFQSKTHCKEGHEFTPENTGIRKSNGSKVCKTCNRKRSNNYWLKKRVRGSLGL